MRGHDVASVVMFNDPRLSNQTAIRVRPTSVPARMEAPMEWCSGRLGGPPSTEPPARRGHGAHCLAAATSPGRRRRRPRGVAGVVPRRSRAVRLGARKQRVHPLPLISDPEDAPCSGLTGSWRRSSRAMPSAFARAPTSSRSPRPRSACVAAGVWVFGRGLTGRWPSIDRGFAGLVAVHAARQRGQDHDRRLGASGLHDHRGEPGGGRRRGAGPTAPV